MSLAREPDDRFRDAKTFLRALEQTCSQAGIVLHPQQTAQTMRFEQQNAELELIDGMKDIQGQLIDVDQLAVEMQLDTIGILEARQSIETLLQLPFPVAMHQGIRHLFE